MIFIPDLITTQGTFNSEGKLVKACKRFHIVDMLNFSSQISLPAFSLQPPVWCASSTPTAPQTSPVSASSVTPRICAVSNVTRSTLPSTTYQWSPRCTTSPRRAEPCSSCNKAILLKHLVRNCYNVSTFCGYNPHNPIYPLPHSPPFNVGSMLATEDITSTNNDCREQGSICRLWLFACKLSIYLSYVLIMKIWH